MSVTLKSFICIYLSFSHYHDEPLNFIFGNKENTLTEPQFMVHKTRQTGQYQFENGSPE